MEVDDIKTSIMSVASGFNPWEQLTPAMFADALDAGHAKYDRLIQGWTEGDKKQKGIPEVTGLCLACSLHPD